MRVGSRMLSNAMPSVLYEELSICLLYAAVSRQDGGALVVARTSVPAKAELSSLEELASQWPMCPQYQSLLASLRKLRLGAAATGRQAHAS